jgi:hypothetical protein
MHTHTNPHIHTYINTYAYMSVRHLSRHSATKKEKMKRGKSYTATKKPKQKKGGGNRIHKLYTCGDTLPQINRLPMPHQYKFPPPPLPPLPPSTLLHPTRCEREECCALYDSKRHEQIAWQKFSKVSACYIHYINSLYRENFEK